MPRRVLVALALASLIVQPRVATLRDPYEVATLCTPYPINIGRRVPVSNGTELQRALDSAVAGDVIEVAVGATFHPVAEEGSFVLRNRSIPQGQWVIVRSASAAFDPSGLLRPNTRVDKSNAGEMPRIRATTNNIPAIATEPRASGYRLVGLDVGAEESIRQLTTLIDLRSADSSASAQPSDIVVDRCYLHGNDAGNFRRGVALNGARLAVVESYVENFHDANTDSQAVGGWTGTGPIKIVNNFLEAASENIMFGGGDPSVPNLVTSDIEVRRNLGTKRAAWRTSGVPVKNAFELKNARRVLVEGNVFENVWASGQDGTAIVLKSTNQDGGCPWCVTEYVTFRNNIVQNAAHGLVINAAETGRPGVALPVQANHIRMDNVLFENISGKLLRIFGGVSDASFTHITSRGNPAGILDPRDSSDANPKLVFKYNIVERKYYGIGSGSDEGEKTLMRNFPSFEYDQNVLVNTSPGTDQAISDGALEGRYPPRTWVAAGWDAVGLVANTSRLTARSRFHAAAADGRDIGADLDAIDAARNGPGGSAACSPSTANARVPRR